MKAKKSGTKKASKKTGSAKRNRRAAVLIIASLAAIVGAGAFLFHHLRATDPANQAPSSVKTQSDATETMGGAGESNRNLVGRWVRPDGGYVVEIAAVTPDGSLHAAYFNPRPVNVSRAVSYFEAGQTKVFIELNDVGYPQATYALVYDEQKDILAGLYYQPSYGQTFEVVFVRTR